jgi:hypothetical protein
MLGSSLLCLEEHSWGSSSRDCYMRQFEDGSYQRARHRTPSGELDLSRVDSYHDGSDAVIILDMRRVARR